MDNVEKSKLLIQDSTSARQLVVKLV